ncbi:hypothetical protein CSUB01_08105 [Colletotrichum sublineola]|uniref:Uncharacterized protein n=1 Tax=Colletotrichum sublineola TaxID=1173701 RepID=A0A066XE59_COLSU|nr:hypothetical protein CSUB01_08105 [Colletotrichum sublineola]
MTNNLSETTVIGVQVQEVDELFASPRAALASGSDNAIFAIGGMMKRLAADSEDAAATPITVRRDSRELAHGRKVAFPVQQNGARSARGHRGAPTFPSGNVAEDRVRKRKRFSGRMNPQGRLKTIRGPIPGRRFSKTQTDPEQEEERKILERV